MEGEPPIGPATRGVGNAQEAASGTWDGAGACESTPRMRVIHHLIITPGHAAKVRAGCATTSARWLLIGQIPALRCAMGSPLVKIIMHDRASPVEIGIGQIGQGGLGMHSAGRGGDGSEKNFDLGGQHDASKGARLRPFAPFTLSPRR